MASNATTKARARPMPNALESRYNTDHLIHARRASPIAQLLRGLRPRRRQRVRPALPVVVRRLVPRRHGQREYIKYPLHYYHECSALEDVTFRYLVTDDLLKPRVTSTKQGERRPLMRRSAISTTLIAVLELVRQGKADLRQDGGAYSPIYLKPADRPSAND